MGKYVTLNKNSKKGEIGLSKNVFLAIAENSLKQINGIISINEEEKTVVDKNNVEVSFKDGKAIYKILVNVKDGVDEENIKTKIKEVLTNNLLYMLDTAPFEIIVKINKNTL